MIEKRDQRVAIVTGGSRGIGRAICLELARHGYYLIVNYKGNESAAAQTLEQIQDMGGDGQLRQFDVCDFEAVQKNIDEISAEFKSIDILVNNAGINADQLFVMMPREDWQKVIKTGLDGFYNMTRLVLEIMIPQKKGSVVSISSASATMGNRGQANYSAAKAGLIGASRVVASEVARLGIRVNVVAPGLIDTDMLKDVSMGNLKQLIPMARIGRPEEVAKVVRFLCSEDASYITGQVVSVNGGMGG